MLLQAEGDDRGAADATRGLAAEKALLFDLRVEIATLFGVGEIRFASGTFASAATVPLAALAAPLGPAVYLALTLAAILVAFWSAGAGERHFGSKDPHAVVIDEVAGQMVALALVPLSWTGFLAGFLLFRFFDIVKPPPASQLERLPGSAGVVLDDLVAGLYANLVLHALLRLASFLGWA